MLVTAGVKKESKQLLNWGHVSLTLMQSIKYWDTEKEKKNTLSFSRETLQTLLVFDVKAQQWNS